MNNGEHSMEILILCVFNILVYYRTLNYGLVMDDMQWFAKREKEGFIKIKDIKKLHDLKSWFDQRFYSGTTFGTDIKKEHAFTIFLHTMICVLIYLTLGVNHISFWAAMLYACHPINNQTSIWLNGRRYAINIILVLMMMLIPILSPILYLMTGLLQVTAFFAPTILIAHSLWIMALIPLFIAIGWKKINSKCNSRISPLANGDLKNFRWSRLIVVVKTFGFFVSKMIFPQVCCMQYPDRFNWGLTQEGNKNAYAIDKDFSKGIFFIILFLSLIVFLPNLSFKSIAIFTFLAILQWCAILPIVQILSDRYMSLPNVFMMFFLSYLSSFSGIFYIPIMVLIIAYYLLCLSIVMPMYKNIMSYYDYHIHNHPQIPWPRTLLIADLFSEGKNDLASSLTFEGLKINQKDYSLLMWGSIMSLIKGQLDHAESFLKEAEKNFYIGQEDKQILEIYNMRENIRKLTPVPKKIYIREKFNYIKRKR